MYLGRALRLRAALLPRWKRLAHLRLPHLGGLQNLPWYEALILSISSFHGRGFFQPLQTLGDPVAIIASVEAVFGLFIEVAFIATFTQRFFGK